MQTYVHIVALYFRFFSKTPSAFELWFLYHGGFHSSPPKDIELYFTSLNKCFNLYGYNNKNTNIQKYNYVMYSMIMWRSTSYKTLNYMFFCSFSVVYRCRLFEICLGKVFALWYNFIWNIDDTVKRESSG